MEYKAECSLPVINYGSVAYHSILEAYIKKGLPENELDQALISEMFEKLRNETRPFRLVIAAYLLTRDITSALCDLPFLKVVSLEGHDPNPLLLARLKALSAIDELWLWFYQMSDEFLHLLSAFPNITRLYLKQTKISDHGMAALGKMRQLEELNLDDTRITDAGLLNISSLTNLAALSLSECGNITDSGLKALIDMKEMKHLNLVDARRITDSFVQNVTHMKNLKELVLLGCPQLTDKALEDLSELSSITEFDIGSNKITSRGLECLARLTNLTKLDVDTNKLRDEDLRLLAPLKNLQSLCLASSRLTNAVFRYLGQFPFLSDVSIYSNGITDACLNEMTHCSNIETMFVCSERMSERVDNILKERQPGLEWALQYYSEETESLEPNDSAAPEPPDLSDDDDDDDDDDDAYAVGETIIESLRRQLNKIIRPIKKYYNSIDDGERSCALKDVESMRKILEEFLEAIEDKQGDEKNLYRAVEKAVDKLNKLDEKTDHGLIETDEREALCAFFDAGAAYVGVDADDIAGEWRDW
jgi:ribosome-associated translation inhibitor RaiA